jgi:sialate O-acetylesterase
LRAFLFFAVLSPITWGAFGQTIDFKESRIAMTELAGPWRFHAEDNPSWANPDTPDSDWSILYAAKSWDEQGYRGYSGVAWYRLRVLDIADGQLLAFYLPSVDESCQIFINGRLIG